MRGGGPAWLPIALAGGLGTVFGVVLALVLGVIREQNWQVTSQDPVSGQLLQTGSTVRLRIERR